MSPRLRGTGRAGRQAQQRGKGEAWGKGQRRWGRGKAGRQVGAGQAEQQCPLSVTSQPAVPVQVWKGVQCVCLLAKGGKSPKGASCLGQRRGQVSCRVPKSPGSKAMPPFFCLHRHRCHGMGMGTKNPWGQSAHEEGKGQG